MHTVEFNICLVDKETLFHVEKNFTNDTIRLLRYMLHITDLSPVGT